jgi:hypothetical protein
MSYQCKIQIPPVEGLKEQELTVGREFILVCEGAFPKDLAVEKLHFIMDAKAKYAIQLRSMEFRSTTEADITVTSLIAGKITIPNLQLTDDTQTLDLGQVAFEVTSVLPPPDPQNQTKQEAFGPIGPAHLPVPPLYWALLGGVILLAAIIASMRIYRVVQRRKMMEELREHDAAISPLAQFHQGFRKIQRQNKVFFGVANVPQEDVLQCVDETYHMLKLYLTRKFQVPALEWSPRLVIKDIRRHHPRHYAQDADELGKLYKEYERAFQDKEHLKAQDVLAIANHCRSLVEKMERLT